MGLLLCFPCHYACFLYVMIHNNIITTILLHEGLSHYSSTLFSTKLENVVPKSRHDGRGATCSFKKT